MRKQENQPNRQPHILQNLLSTREIQSKLMEQCRDAALAFGVEMLNQEVEKLCGSKFSHKSEGQFWRGGSDKTRIVVGGEKMQIPRPRVRGSDGEVELSSLAQLQDQDIFDEEIRDRMMLGVSTRNYQPVMKSWAKKLSTSKSNVSRAFIKASRKDLDKINTCDLSGYEFVALMIDGVHIAERTVIVVLGITNDCQKIPIGIREGDTENSEVVRDLLTSIRDRNFKQHTDRLLAVSDGSKALKKGLKDIFGDAVVLQRCWLHKLRNLQKYVPDHLHKQLWWRMKKLMNLKNYSDAKVELGNLIGWLAEISYEAESSMKEVGLELLTVHDLEINGELRKALSTTNPIESLMGAIRNKTSRVKNWKSSKKKDQILRWVASSVLAHQKKMRRLRGWKGVDALIKNLKTKVERIEKAA